MRTRNPRPAWHGQFRTGQAVWHIRRPHGRAPWMIERVMVTHLYGNGVATMSGRGTTLLYSEYIQYAHVHRCDAELEVVFLNALLPYRDATADLLVWGRALFVVGRQVLAALEGR